MFQYLMVLFAVVAVIGAPSLESLATAGPMMDYIIAAGIALMLKPWLQGHFE
jgi:hypothetical protein